MISVSIIHFLIGLANPTNHPRIRFMRGLDGFELHEGLKELDVTIELTRNTFTKGLLSSFKGHVILLV